MKTFEYDDVHDKNEVQNVQVVVLAVTACAAITATGRSLDVRLNLGKGAQASLRESAEENRLRAARLLTQADLMDAAADWLHEDGRN